MKLASSLVLLSVLLLSVLLFCSAAAAQSPESPRIAALQNALQQRSPNAVEAFWHDVQVAGAPLVERVNERRGYSLVTFLWRGDAQQVFVAGHLGQLTGTRRSDNALARLGDTTVWFRSYWLPSDARTVYQIAVNVPLTGPEGVGSCTALRRPDIFGNVLSLSGSFWWRPAGEPEGEWVIREYARKPKTDIRFFMSVGLLEIVSTRNVQANWIDDPDSNIPYGPSMAVVNRHMRDVLRMKGYQVTYAEVAGPHHGINWQGTFGDGLIDLLGSKQQSAR